ncbi:MAG: hypothetical protein MI861_13365, partial [Pirellulales bacterium]|nr:hypothetical protein [Pirellulales bacterium]
MNRFQNVSARKSSAFEDSRSIFQKQHPPFSNIPTTDAQIWHLLFWLWRRGCLHWGFVWFGIGFYVSKLLRRRLMVVGGRRVLGLSLSLIRYAGQRLRLGVF